MIVSRNAGLHCPAKDIFKKHQQRAVSNVSLNAADNHVYPPGNKESSSATFNDSLPTDYSEFPRESQLNQRPLFQMPFQRSLSMISTQNIHLHVHIMQKIIFGGVQTNEEYLKPFGAKLSDPSIQTKKLPSYLMNFKYVFSKSTPRHAEHLIEYHSTQRNVYHRILFNHIKILRCDSKPYNNRFRKKYVDFADSLLFHSVEVHGISGGYEKANAKPKITKLLIFEAKTLIQSYIVKIVIYKYIVNYQ